MWYPRGFKRPRRQPNLRWDHDIRKQADARWSRQASNQHTWAVLKIESVWEVTPQLDMVEIAENDDDDNDDDYFAMTETWGKNRSRIHLKN